MAEATPEEKDPAYLKGYNAALQEFMLKLMAKSQRVEDRIHRLTGEGDPWKK